MKRNHGIALIATVAAAIIGIFIWGTNRQPTDNIIRQDNQQQPGAITQQDSQQQADTTGSPTDKPIRTLSILTHRGNEAAIRQAVFAMYMDRLEMNNPYTFRVSRDFHSRHAMSFEDKEAIATRLRVELMAGQGPDIIMLCPWFFTMGALDFHSLVNSGFIRDIYTLMDTDPGTDRDEFFPQALSAFEINNGLYSFPVSFGFQYLGINTSLPQDFIERFTGKAYITFLDMMAFYLDLMEEHPDEFGHLSFGTGGSLNMWSSVVQAVMCEFIDFDTRRSSLTDPCFADALELMGKVYTYWEEPCIEVWVALSYRSLSHELMQKLAQEVVFHNQSSSINNFYAFFDTEESFFRHHIPIVDEQGRLLIYQDGLRGQIWNQVLITAGNNADLAWELTRYLAYAFANPEGEALRCPEWRVEVEWGNNSLATPIMRSLFEDHTRRSFEQIFNTWSLSMQAFVGMEDPTNRARLFDNATRRIAAYNGQPMRMLHPMIPNRLIEEHLDQFMIGLIDAQTAAQRMHNAVSLWLIE